ncbi:hypothetical protein Zmor_026690 [Zophobas morio]|uniref:DDE Tnp4 domain-containing protein n=1 Tax=Zophobas morio TaxID=2755281 RepID=A0AA38HUG0_9CUCU|nr:hypothetical protein Zmor_026690 [Zophobas morio]
MSVSLTLTSSSSSDDSDVPVPRRPRIFRDRSDPFDRYDDIDFKQRYRFSKNSVVEILNQIGDRLDPLTNRNKALNSREQLLICLRFYATGAFQQLIGDSVLVHKSTISRIIYKVSKEILRLKGDVLKMPTLQEIPTIHRKFFEIRGFPCVIGAIDGTHIPIQSPGGHLAETYRCRKGFFSLNVQVVCDAELQIRHIIARWPGSVHDSTIFNDCPLPPELERGMYGAGYLLGDSGYACKRYLLTPFINPRNRAEEAYNASHKATRNTVERCFGVLKRRFPALSMGLRLKMKTNMMAIVACAILHNLAIIFKDDWPEDHLEVEEDDEVIGGDPMEGNFAMRTHLVNTIFAERV